MSECIDKDCMRAGSADAGSCVHCQWQGMLDEVIELDDLREECDRLRAERDRLRDALREMLDAYGKHHTNRALEQARAALGDTQ